MTREELEEGRRLWSRRDLNQFPFEKWLLTHADELLSLAEEARWRSVTEEPPQTNTWVCAVNDTVVVSGFVCCAGPGAWISYHGGHSIPAPTHWRPLAKRPEER